MLGNHLSTAYIYRWLIDGWIPIDEFPLIVSAYREAYEQWIEVARQAVASGDVEMSVKKAEKLWPFDQR
jgi:hypothetical protein